MDDVYQLLCLVSVPGIGSHRIRKLVGHFGSPKAVLDAGTQELCHVDGIDEKTARNIQQKVDRSFADEELSRIEKQGAHLVIYWDPKYPKMLKKIYDPPVLLYVMGVLDEKEENRIAVVGTRSPSQYGRWVAERFGEDFATRGITVVSGMARGIDTWAHRGALKGGGKTIAVLGCGLNVVYPAENRKLYKMIADSGAVLSEFPMNAEPAGVHFPRRNRIISGLSFGTVVVEAGEKSGALITAYMALDQGREVFAVPGSIRSSKTKGTHRLIKEGAKLVESLEDVLAEIPQWKEKGKKRGKKRDVSKLLSDGEKRLWGVLSEEPIHIDRITMKAKITTSEALAMLLSMELKNCVKQLSGMMFVRE